MNRVQAFFEDLAGRWNAQQPADRPEVLRQMLAPFAGLLQEAHAILEVGSGTGALIPPLSAAASRARLVSLDLAHAMLRQARRREGGALLVQADAHHLPFGARAFDLVVCHNCFPHFADQQAALGELAGALLPGGHLLIVHDLSREQVNAIHRGVGGAIGDHLLPPGEEARRMLLAAGLVEVEVEDTAARYLAVGRAPC